MVCRGVHVFVFVMVAIAAGHGTEARATTHLVELVGFEFIPSELVIDVGDTVHWVWVTGFHNVESGTIAAGIGVPDGNFRSGNPTSGATFDLVFDQARLDAKPMPGNIYPYYCIVHAGSNMAGTITVIAAGDLDRDTDVDAVDQRIATRCMGGPDDGAPPEGCTQEQWDRADIDEDGDVDLQDLAAVQLAFTR